MLLVFVIGIDQTGIYGGCVAVSALIQYFTLVAVMWMGAEAILMFQKLVIVFTQITTKYIIGVSIICWGEHGRSKWPRASRVLAQPLIYHSLLCTLHLF